MKTSKTIIVSISSLITGLLPLSTYGQDLEISRSKRTGRVIFATVTSPTVPAANSPLSVGANPSPSATPGVEATSIRTAAAYAGATTGATDPTITADAFVSSFGETIGIPVPTTNLVPARVEDDRLGMSHVRYEHRYQGVPVLGGDVVVHIGKDGAVRSASANVLPGLKTNMRALIPAKLAKQIAIGIWKREHGRKYTPSITSIEKFVYAPALIKNDNSTLSYLVWEVRLRSEVPLTSDIYYLDARNGKLRFRTEDIRGLDRWVSDCSGLPGSNNCYSALSTMEFGYPYVFGRREGSAAYGVNPRLIPEEYVDTDKAYDYLGQLHTFYQQVLNRNGGNGQGGTNNGMLAPVTRSSVSVYADFLNQWSCPFAAFDNGRVYLCKGQVVPDTIAHEYAHAVPYYSVPGGLIYQGESGALDESYADISGEIFEKAVTGTADWLAGSDNPGGAVRSLSQPSAIPGKLGTTYADRFHSPSLYCGAIDNNGVHLKSTVPSKAAYLLSEGGFFNGCTINQIGSEKVYQIWYRALTQYFVSSETFNGAYFKLIHACRDLYGTETGTCSQVERALQSVEMDQPGGCSDMFGTIPGCVDATGW